MKPTLIGDCLEFTNHHLIQADYVFHKSIAKSLTVNQFLLEVLACLVKFLYLWKLRSHRVYKQLARVQTMKNEVYGI